MYFMVDKVVDVPQRRRDTQNGVQVRNIPKHVFVGKKNNGDPIGVLIRKLTSGR